MCKAHIVSLHRLHARGRSLEAMVTVAVAARVGRPSVEVPYQLGSEDEGAYSRRHLRCYEDHSAGCCTA